MTNDYFECSLFKMRFSNRLTQTACEKLTWTLPHELRTSIMELSVSQSVMSNPSICLRTKYRVRLVQLLQNADRSSILIILTQAESFMELPQVVGNGRCEVTSIDENWSMCVRVCMREWEKERKRMCVCA